jgi:hypothetical protein
MSTRFVILAHTVNGSTHFDLMLEVEGHEKLRTFQLARWPVSVGGSCAAPQIGDHRRAYLEYEGEVSGGRGTVTRVQAGTWLEDGGAIVLSTGERLRHAGDEIHRVG